MVQGTESKGVLGNPRALGGSGDSASKAFERFLLRFCKGSRFTCFSCVLKDLVRRKVRSTFIVIDKRF